MVITIHQTMEVCVMAVLKNVPHVKTITTATHASQVSLHITVFATLMPTVQLDSI